MKKVFLLCAVFASIISMGFSLEVDEKELNVQGSIDSIQFENYGGPHAVIESARAITNIGTELGTEVSKDILNPSVIKPQAKYSLIHAIPMHRALKQTSWCSTKMLRSTMSATCAES